MWDLLKGFLDWTIEIYNFMKELWTSSFDIGDIHVTFPAMVTTSLIALTALWVVKKFIPLT